MTGLGYDVITGDSPHCCTDGLSATCLPLDSRSLPNAETPVGLPVKCPLFFSVETGKFIFATVLLTRLKLIVK
jgi:hypothetical protein